MSDPRNDQEKNSGISRRSFLKGVGVSSAATGVLLSAEGCAGIERTNAGGGRIKGPGPVPITLRVNGKEYTRDLEPRISLLNVLRNELDLTGTKLVCDRGSCGGCTVELDGKIVNSCMVLAIDAQGKEITTIEGVADGSQLHPVQESFVEFDALMCGFCTPGMVMSCKNLLDRNDDPSLDEIKEATSGNLCRCGTYPHIFQAVKAAAGNIRGRG